VRKATLALLALFLAACSTPSVGTSSSIPVSSGISENGNTVYGGNDTPGGPIVKANDTPGGPIVAKAAHEKGVRRATASYTYHGCGVYSSTDLFFRDVSSVGVDSHSATIISQLPTPSPNNFATDDQSDEQVNLGTSATPTYTVGHIMGGHNPAMYPASAPPPAPWVPGWFIEPISDGHAVSMLTDTCADFETYKTVWAITPVKSGHRASPLVLGNLTAFDGQENDLTSSWASQMVPENDAMTQSGIPFLGTVDYGEDAAAVAAHVLAMMMEAGIGVSQWGYVYPATMPSFVADTGCGGSACAHPLHEGDVLRLQSIFSCTGTASVTYTTKGQRICNQLKTYGIILTDQTSGAYQLRFGLKTNGGMGWNYSNDLQPLLANLHITNFDVMDESAVGGIKCLSGHSGCL
jgi:hypothetical protein